MRRVLALITTLLLCLPVTAAAQDARATLQGAARALGADGLKSLTYTASGVNFAIGQSAVPGAAWPRFNVPTFSRAVNYETASLREEQVRSRAEMPPRGGGTPAMGELRAIQVVSGDLAWNVTGETAAPSPVALTERQLQLWVYLPKERLLIQADAFTLGPPNAPVPAIINPLSVNLADNIARLNLGVDRLLPLHGRMVPLAELYRMIGRSN